MEQQNQLNQAEVIEIQGGFWESLAVVDWSPSLKLTVRPLKRDQVLRELS